MGDQPKPPLPPDFDDISAFTDADTGRLDAYLRTQLERCQYPSLSVAIVHDGRVVYCRAFGFEDIEAQTPATPQTAYHVASVTKVFTTTLAAMLHERGVVGLDQPVVKYLPQGVSISTRPDVGATITLRQLASHTSGLPRMQPGPIQRVDGRYDIQPRMLYDQLARTRLRFDPGTDHLYSNLGVGLLGHALERAAGRPYDKLIQEMICQPLHLDHTTIQPTDAIHPATGYTAEVPRGVKVHSYRKRLAPAGGLITTPTDLALFLDAQMKPGFLSEAVRDLLHTPTRLNDGSEVNTALGWAVSDNDIAGRILKKNGGLPDCNAWIGFAPEHDTAVAVCTNCGGPSVSPIGQWLLVRSVARADSQ